MTYHRETALVWLIWLFICMGNPLAINITAHIIHHPWPCRYAPMASQLWAARGDASKVRLKMVFATFGLPLKYFLTHQEKLYTLTCQHFFPPMYAKDVCMWHITPPIHLQPWIHLTDITSAVINFFLQDYFVSAQRHMSLLWASSPEFNQVCGNIKSPAIHRATYSCTLCMTL